MKHTSGGIKSRHQEQPRTPRPPPRMMQSAHKLSLILMGLRCGCCIILAQDGDLQPVPSQEAVSVRYES